MLKANFEPEKNPHFFANAFQVQRKSFDHEENLLVPSLHGHSPSNPRVHLRVGQYAVSLWNIEE